MIFTVFALGGIYLAWQHRNGQQPQREETLLYFASSLFFIIAWLVSINPQFDISTARKFIHLPLLIPIYIFLKHIGITIGSIWAGLVTGSLIAAAIAIYEVQILELSRARSLTHPIIFGDLALIMGFMSLAGLGWFRSRSKPLILLPVIAVIAGIIASTLAEARGSWVAIPFMALVMLWTLRSSLSRKQILIIALAFTSFLLLLYLIPQTGVSEQVNRTINNVEAYHQSEITSPLRATSIGGRFELWQASFTLFSQNIWSGIGWGQFQPMVQELVQQQLRNDFIAQFNHPHNQFISALVNGGIFSFLGLVLLFAIPAKILLKHLKRDDTDTQQLAQAGLILLVGFFIFAQSEAILERSRPINFFVFYLAVIMAAIYHRQQVLQSKQYTRKHKLSVTIITKNEEDRIEDCLKSVHGWADEIILLDSGSTDNTLEIAHKYTDKIYQTDWPGYGIQKQRALEKASGDWVLSIDADERVSPELRQDIDRVLSVDTPDCAGYKTPWAVILFGHRMDFGRSARAPLRLFKREGSHFTDSIIHERVELPEPCTVNKLEGRLLHYTHRDYGHGTAKACHYAWLSSQKYFAEKRFGAGLVGATIKSAWTFVLIYILRLGFLDGAAGYVSAINYAQNSFNKYAGLWSLRRETSLNKRD